MSGQRQKTRPEPGVLAFPGEGRRAAPKTTEKGTERRMAKRKSESLGREPNDSGKRSARWKIASRRYNGSRPTKEVRAWRGGASRHYRMTGSSRS
jgi:hypothetical protein